MNTYSCSHFLTLQLLPNTASTKARFPFHDKRWRPIFRLAVCSSTRTFSKICAYSEIELPKYADRKENRFLKSTTSTLKILKQSSTIQLIVIGRDTWYFLYVTNNSNMAYHLEIDFNYWMITPMFFCSLTPYYAVASVGQSIIGTIGAVGGSFL